MQIEAVLRFRARTQQAERLQLCEQRESAEFCQNLIRNWYSLLKNWKRIRLTCTSMQRISELHVSKMSVITFLKSNSVWTRARRSNDTYQKIY